jgi:hypothetical protein
VEAHRVVKGGDSNIFWTIGSQMAVRLSLLLADRSSPPGNKYSDSLKIFFYPEYSRMNGKYSPTKLIRKSVSKVSGWPLGKLNVSLEDILPPLESAFQST